VSHDPPSLAEEGKRGWHVTPGRADRRGNSIRRARPTDKTLYPTSRRGRALGHLVPESTDYRAPLCLNNGRA
jgi:hypothetical protein